MVVDFDSGLFGLYKSFDVDLMGLRCPFLILSIGHEEPLV